MTITEIARLAGWDAIEKSLYLTLAAAAAEGGEVVASTNDLAQWTGFSRFSISAARRALLDRGLLEVERYDIKGRPIGKENSYRVIGLEVDRAAAVNGAPQPPSGAAAAAAAATPSAAVNGAPQAPSGGAAAAAAATVDDRRLAARAALVAALSILDL